MITSDKLDLFSAAFSQAQGKIEQAPRTHTATVATRSGGSYSYSYTDLATVLAMCRSALAESGLAIVQSAKFEQNQVTVTTRLLHSSGQWLESDPLSLPVVSEREDGKITPQAIGSSTTYAKRYSLCSLLGIASEADDDGNAGSGTDAATAPKEPLPECPECKSNKAVIVGKSEFGGGLLCWKKKDGCGHSWTTDKYPAAGETQKPEPTKAANKSSGRKQQTLKAGEMERGSEAMDPLCAPRNQLDSEKSFTNFCAKWKRTLEEVVKEDADLDTKWRQCACTWLKGHIPQLTLDSKEKYELVRVWIKTNLPDLTMQAEALRVLDARQNAERTAA